MMCDDGLYSHEIVHESLPGAVDGAVLGGTADAVEVDAGAAGAAGATAGVEDDDARAPEPRTKITV